MIRSMTGFGEAELETAGGTLSVQVRTVNHRHFNVHFRAPEALERWESEITTILRERIARGHVRYRLDVSGGPGAEVALQVDHERVRAYVAGLRELQETHGIAGELDLGALLRLGDVFRVGPPAGEGVTLEDVAAVTRRTIEGVIETRAAEGAALLEDLTASLGAIDGALDVIAERAPERLERERDRLRAAVAELAESVEADEERLAREIAYVAERWDINEEIVRLRAHLAGFRETLDEGPGPVGKRLSFWVQEMHREANTIGSKANDAQITAQVVEMKTAIEKIREQVENIE